MTTIDPAAATPPAPAATVGRDTVPDEPTVRIDGELAWRLLRSSRWQQ